jgi:hypothetical protein
MAEHEQSMHHRKSAMSRHYLIGNDDYALSNNTIKYNQSTDAYFEGAQYN